MWVDIAQEVEPEPEARSDDEETVYDRNSEFRRNPFADNGRERSRMLEEGDTRCGIWGWRPEWLQKLVSQNSFITAFVLSGVLNGASWSYFSASISTMEKRLKISSETTGVNGNSLSFWPFVIFNLGFMFQEPCWPEAK